MGNCVDANPNKKDELHKLESSLVECKSTQTDNYSEDDHPIVTWKNGEMSEKMSTDECRSDNQFRRRVEERHVHVHNPNAVIVGHNGKIIVGKHKRKKSIGSLHSEVKQQLMISTDIVSSSSSNQSEHGYNQKSNQRVARQLDLESSTSDSEKINSDDSEEDRSLRCNAMVKLKQCKTAAEIEKIVLDLKLELMKRTETKTKTLEKYFLGLLSTTDIPEQSNVKKLQHLDSLTKRENSSNMYTVI